MKNVLFLFITFQVHSFNAEFLIKSSALIYRYYANSIDGNHSPVGSGFFIKPDLVVTNYHVVDGLNNKTILVRNCQGKFLYAQILLKAIEVDLAIVKVTDYKSEFFYNINESEDPLVGMDVYGLANFGVSGGFLTKNTISAVGVSLANEKKILRQNLVGMVGTTNPGSSGGAVVSSNNKLVGICAAKSVFIENVGYFINYRVLKNIINNNYKFNYLKFKPKYKTLVFEDSKYLKVGYGIYILNNFHGLKKDDVIHKLESQVIFNKNIFEGKIQEGSNFKATVLRSNKFIEVELDETYFTTH